MPHKRDGLHLCQHDSMIHCICSKLVQEKNSEISELKNLLTTLNKQIVTLEERIEENDIYERSKTLVLSGSKLPVQNASEKI